VPPCDDFRHVTLRWLLTAMVDLDTVDRLLGAPPGYPSWRIADMAIRKGILATWLSSAVARGIEISDGARAYLQRNQRRVADLHLIGEEMARTRGVAVLKGPRIAAYLPAPLLRQSGDVDLVAPDQESLWRSALDLSSRYSAVPHGISVLDGPGGIHIGVTMKWPAEEPHLDKPMSADITTCAFAGDLRGVPVRVAPVPQDDLCGLFAVAEERFQHKFRVKDMLDLLALAEVLEQRLADRLPETICEHAARLALAPELRQLIAKTNEWVSISERWQDTLEALRPLAQQEKALRRPDRPGMHRLRFGFPLNADTSADLAVSIHRRNDGDIATTPLGTCLLLDRPVLSEDMLTDAAGYARSLATAASS
jgi:hypothetical protein